MTITHISIIDLPAREYPNSMEPLSTKEQKRLAKVIRENIYSEIGFIKVSHIDLETKCIYIKARPSMYLNNGNLVLLEI